MVKMDIVRSDGVDGNGVEMGWCEFKRKVGRKEMWLRTYMILGCSFSATTVDITHACFQR